MALAYDGADEQVLPALLLVVIALIALLNRLQSTEVVRQITGVVFICGQSL